MQFLVIVKRSKLNYNTHHFENIIDTNNLTFTSDYNDQKNKQLFL